MAKTPRETLVDLVTERDGKRQAHQAVEALVIDTNDPNAVVAFEIQRELISRSRDRAEANFSAALQRYVANQPDHAVLFAAETKTVGDSVLKQGGALPANIASIAP